ncbi:MULTISPECIES: zf-HC2 domain-containing protein [Kitasatospora]|uniref:Putative anti-sigma factor n=1 Tax=Kitasatospora setae (strain ATCC 33774 / DSM 43861 / JCM 3304 / KCC A-0304 / NBRC 14216 / KM-6054) TaxID=452652 RepID=E4N8Y3_KITSK|nr:MULTISPECIES: zf-HC2 domain-containing protein [Kitasatospora]BAJ27664.1 putative anti-sigma factor [Kitasatospora setae KM-6054]
MTTQHRPDDPPDDPHPGPHPGPHADLGAHLLGVLEPDRAARFADHLAHCPRCAAEAADLAPATALLAELAADADPSAAPSAAPTESAGEERLLARVAGERRRARVRRLVLAAVAAVLALGGPAVTWAALDGGPAAPVAAQRFGATDPATGVSAAVGVDPAAWGSRITLDLSHVPGPRTCELVAVGTDGTRQTVTTWTVPPTGYGATTDLRTGGGSGLAPGAISRFEVRAGTAVLVTVPVR